MISDPYFMSFILRSIRSVAITFCCLFSVTSSLAENPPQTVIERGLQQYVTRNPLFSGNPFPAKALDDATAYQIGAFRNTLKSFQIENSYDRAVEGEQIYFYDIKAEVKGPYGTKMSTLSFSFVRRGQAWYMLDENGRSIAMILDSQEPEAPAAAPATPRFAPYDSSGARDAMLQQGIFAPKEARTAAPTLPPPLPDVPEASPKVEVRRAEPATTTPTINPPEDSAEIPSQRSLTGERYPQTRQRLLTLENIKGLSAAEVRYAINEIYARYGATFPDHPDVQRQFQKFDWYHPKPKLTFEDIDKSMSDIERENIKVLAQYRAILKAR